MGFCALSFILMSFLASLSQSEHQCKSKLNLGKMYNKCGTVCPLTCTNLYDDYQCPEICNEGCFCRPGMIENRRGQCIRATRCMCEYEGKMFAPGQVFIPVSCVKCTCLRGRMLCIEVCNIIRFAAANRVRKPIAVEQTVYENEHLRATYLEE